MIIISETQTITILAQMAGRLQEIANILRMGFQSLTNAIYRTAEISTSLMAIGQQRRLGSSDFFKQQAGITAKGGSVGMAKINEVIANLFSGKTDIFAGMAPSSTKEVPMAGGKKLTDMFKGIGKSLMAAFGPMALLMQILSPLINAVLEPLDIMSPLMEQWGTILSQLLVPIMLALMEALMPLTPTIQMLVFSLMPLIEIFVRVILMAKPLIEILAMLANVILGFVGIITNSVSIINVAFAWLEKLFTTIKTSLEGAFGNAVAFFIDLGNKIGDVFRDMVDNILSKIKDKFNIFKGGGLDNDTSTWW